MRFGVGMGDWGLGIRDLGSWVMGDWDCGVFSIGLLSDYLTFCLILCILHGIPGISYYLSSLIL